VVIDIEEFPPIPQPEAGSRRSLLHGLKSDELAAELDQIIAERKLHPPREIDLTTHHDLSARHECGVRDS